MAENGVAEGSVGFDSDETAAAVYVVNKVASGPYAHEGAEDMAAVVGDGAVNGEPDGVDGRGVELGGESALGDGLLHNEIATPTSFEESDGERGSVGGAEPVVVGGEREEFDAVALSGVERRFHDDGGEAVEERAETGVVAVEETIFGIVEMTVDAAADGGREKAVREKAVEEILVEIRAAQFFGAEDGLDKAVADLFGDDVEVGADVVVEDAVLSRADFDAETLPESEPIGLAVAGGVGDGVAEHNLLVLGVVKTSKVAIFMVAQLVSDEGLEELHEVISVKFFHCKYIIFFAKSGEFEEKSGILGMRKSR